MSSQYLIKIIKNINLYNIKKIFLNYPNINFLFYCLLSVKIICKTSILVALGSDGDTFKCEIDHKADHVSLYMQQISQHVEEKTQILEHIKSPGTYLEIGSGETSALFLCQKLFNQDCDIIIADLEQAVLNNIKNKKELSGHLQHSALPRMSLSHLDATNMHTIKSHSLDGINASALLHEIYSYSTSNNPLSDFIGEICRCLKDSGYFVYRDPALMDNPIDYFTLSFKTDYAKNFFYLFMNRFFESKLTKDKHHSLYPLNLFSIVAPSKKMSFEQFLKVPSKEILLDGNLLIRTNGFFISELLRHFILYNEDTSNGEESLKDLLTRDNHLDIMKVLSESSKTHQNLPEPIQKALSWFKREGIEHYFYLSLEDFILYFAQQSLAYFSAIEESNKILVPVSSNHIRKSERPKYVSWLKNHFELKDTSADIQQEFVTHKNIVHFKIMPLKEGMIHLQEIALSCKFEKIKTFCRKGT